MSTVEQPQPQPAPTNPAVPTTNSEGNTLKVASSTNLNQSKANLASALNLAVQPAPGSKEGSRSNLEQKDETMKLKKNGSVKVLFEQPDMKAIEPVRRIVTEDLKWNVLMPKPLVECCLSSIVQNVHKKPYLQRLSERYRDRVMDQLPVTLPLQFVATNIPDTDLAGKKHWKKMCEYYFLRPSRDQRRHDNSWRQTFFELYCENIIQSLVPSPELSYADVQAKLQVAQPFVRRLRLRQLRPDQWFGCRGEERIVDSQQLPQKETFNFHVDLLPPLKQTVEKLQKKISAIELYRQAESDGTLKHLDLATILAPFNNLVQLEICYTLREVAMGFRWSLFGLSQKDIAPLRNVLSNNPNLEYLSLRGSLIKDENCAELAGALFEAKALKRLDLSCNRIKDQGLTDLLSLLKVEKNEDGTDKGPVLKSLDLSSNAFGAVGAENLAKALCKNTTLEILKIDMNESIGDAGLATFLKTVSTENFTLKQLNISGCNGANEAAKALSDVIRHYGNVNAKIAHDKDLLEQGLVLSNADLSVKIDAGALAESDDGGSDDEKKDSKSKRRGRTAISKKSAKSTNVKVKAGNKKDDKKVATPKKLGKKGKQQSNEHLTRVQTATSKQDEESEAQNAESERAESAVQEQAQVQQVNAKTEPDWLSLPFPVGFSHISAQSNHFNDNANGPVFQEAIKQNTNIVLFDLRGTQLSDDRIRAINAELSTRRTIDESANWNSTVDRI